MFLYQEIESLRKNLIKMEEKLLFHFKEKNIKKLSTPNGVVYFDKENGKEELVIKHE